MIIPHGHYINTFFLAHSFHLIIFHLIIAHEVALITSKEKPGQLSHQFHPSSFSFFIGDKLRHFLLPLLLLPLLLLPNSRKRKREKPKREIVAVFGRVGRHWRHQRQQPELTMKEKGEEGGKTEKEKKKKKKKKKKKRIPRNVEGNHHKLHARMLFRRRREIEREKKREKEKETATKNQVIGIRNSGRCLHLTTSPLSFLSLFLSFFRYHIS